MTGRWTAACTSRAAADAVTGATAETCVLRDVEAWCATAGAALLALAPAAFNSEDASAPLARAVIGGLASSTLLTLLVVPLLYLQLKPEFNR